jgi:hypothetical protein
VSRKLNPFFELAKEWADEYRGGEADDFTIKRFLRELSTLRKNGVDLELARMAWRQLRSPEGIDGFSVPEAVPITLLKGKVPYWQQYQEWVLENVPPVYESSAHDEYVRTHHGILSKVGFTYRAGRIPEEELNEMGVNHE